MKSAIITLGVCALLSPAAFPNSIFITSRDGGGGDLYQYSTTGAFQQNLKGNGLNNGQGIAVGPNGDVFVANESGGNVLEYNASTGAFVRVFASGLSYPGALTFGPSGDLFVGDGNGIQRFNGTTGALVGLFTNFSTGSPTGLAFGPNGNLFESSGLSGSINQYNGTTGAFINTFASSPLLANGAGDLLFDPSGDLLVAQTFGTGGAGWGNSILKFDANGNYLGNFIQDAHLDGPASMAYGQDGNFWVLNYHGDNMLRYTTAGQFIDVVIPSGGGFGVAPRDFVFTGSGAPVVTATPEPLSMVLCGFGLVGIGLIRRRTRG